ncbi:MAG: hypothetical protein IJI44_08135 [Erysipelotrichaceae bacterium]|nr:hypothetical protein [Erysipelotrichaceae bacterium]
MKKFPCVIAIFLILLLAGGFTFSVYEDAEDKSFSLDDLYDYQKEYKTEELSVCSVNTAKTYMDYRMTTVVSSRQYQFMHNYCTVDRRTGFLYDEEGFIAVALGSFYGEIGDRYYFTLETGIVLPLVKAEEKADEDTNSSGCYHVEDGSVIEFVIDSDYARNYFSTYSNGLVLDGNYNNYSLFRGSIVKVEKVLEEKRDDIVTYQISKDLPKQTDIFHYASGY